MSLEITARKLHIFTEKGIGISLHTFLPFDELSHILSLLGLNSVLKLIFLPQMQIHFLSSLIRAISVKKMKMTYSSQNHCWIISQIQMKLLSSAGEVENSFFRFVLASKFSFFLSFFLSFLFNVMNGSKQGASYTCHYKKKSGGGK